MDTTRSRYRALQLGIEAGLWREEIPKSNNNNSSSNSNKKQHTQRGNEMTTTIGNVQEQQKKDPEKFTMILCVNK